VTILLVEQNAARSIEVADRSYVIQAPGKIIGRGSAWELAENAEVVDYVGFSPIQSGDEK
jgi:branched-chain amino acid transport system ATP-binding protein